MAEVRKDVFSYADLISDPPQAKKKKHMLDHSGFTAEGKLISPPAMPHHL